MNLNKDGTASAGAGNTPGKNGPGRTTFWQAVSETMNDRWKKRRSTPPGATNATPAASTPPGGTRSIPGPKKTSGARTAGRGPWSAKEAWKKAFWKKSGGKNSKAGPKNTGTGRAAGPGGSGAGTGPGPGPGFAGARTSPWDYADPEPATAKVWQAGPARRNGTPWEPTPIAPARRALTHSGPPALPRAPQRGVGQRPGTTRRKEPIPMAPIPTGRYMAVPRPGSMAAPHATEITAGDVCKALEKLTTEGMETYDDCDGLEKQARKLLGALEAMAHDLASDHNVAGKKLMEDVAELQNQVAHLIRVVKEMAKSCLDAAELAEAEETAMKRDHQPVIDATADAGLRTPSSRLHNEN
ncbi:hypothetical protein [Streptomyces ramulosus]|uniref:hypothetical protein n=1 Tax=Streptomyces TaxID=1883 RepID=UPI0031EE99AF